MMKTRTITTILMLTLCVTVLATTAKADMYLTVNGSSKESITLELGQSRSIGVVSLDSSAYAANLGFDDGVARGTFSYTRTDDRAGSLSAVEQYDDPAFYGYFIQASGTSPAPSSGTHFEFEYTPLKTGQAELILYQDDLSTVIDSISITVIPTDVGSAFTYQGQLMDSESSANGQYDFRFELYDFSDPNTENKIGPTVNLNNVNVTDGRFSVSLDFGSNAFNGDGRWLEVSVTQTDSGMPLTTLYPRQAIKPTPYALSAQTVSKPFKITGETNDPIIEAINNGDGDGILGMGTGRNSRGVYGDSTGELGKGVIGVGSGSSVNNNFGGYFWANGSYGQAVYGMATNTGNYRNFGGYFKAAGSTGLGVFGYASNTGNYTNYGGKFQAEGSTGQGVYGEASNTGNYANYGGYFLAKGNFGRGVHGEASSP